MVPGDAIIKTWCKNYGWCILETITDFTAISQTTSRFLIGRRNLLTLSIYAGFAHKTGEKVDIIGIIVARLVYTSCNVLDGQS